MVNSRGSWKTTAMEEASSGPQKVGIGGRVFGLNIRSTGAEQEEIAGRGATSMNGSRWMSAYRLSMSTGTRLRLTADGRVGVCQRKRSGRWRRVQNLRPTVEALQHISGHFPGETIRLL